MIISFLSGLAAALAAIAAGDECNKGSNIVAPPAFKKERRDRLLGLNMINLWRTAILCWKTLYASAS
jgi:hypothetical protein